MRKFRCPNCKNEVIETKFIHINSIFCKICKIEYVKLYFPNQNILKIEKKIARLILNKPKTVITPKFLEIFK